MTNLSSSDRNYRPRGFITHSSRNVYQVFGPFGYDLQKMCAPLGGQSDGSAFSAVQHRCSAHRPQFMFRPSILTQWNGNSLPYQWRVHWVTTSHLSVPPLGPLWIPLRNGTFSTAFFRTRIESIDIAASSHTQWTTYIRPATWDGHIRWCAVQQCAAAGRALLTIRSASMVNLSSSDGVYRPCPFITHSMDRLYQVFRPLWLPLLIL